jgi:hypothetical protein
MGHEQKENWSMLLDCANSYTEYADIIAIIVLMI